MQGGDLLEDLTVHLVKLGFLNVDLAREVKLGISLFLVYKLKRLLQLSDLLDIVLLGLLNLILLN